MDDGKPKTVEPLFLMKFGVRSTQEMQIFLYEDGGIKC